MSSASSQNRESAEAHNPSSATWTDGEEGDLLSVFSKLQDRPDSIEQTTKELQDMGVNKSHENIKSKLLEIGLITDHDSEHVDQVW